MTTTFRRSETGGYRFTVGLYQFEAWRNEAGFNGRQWEVRDVEEDRIALGPVALRVSVDQLATRAECVAVAEEAVEARRQATLSAWQSIPFGSAVVIQTTRLGWGGQKVEGTKYDEPDHVGRLRLGEKFGLNIAAIAEVRVADDLSPATVAISARDVFPNFVPAEADAGRELSPAIVAEIRLSRIAEGRDPDTGKLDCNGTDEDDCADDPDLGRCQACSYVFHNVPRSTDDAHGELCCGTPVCTDPGACATHFEGCEICAHSRLDHSPTCQGAGSEPCAAGEHGFVGEADLHAAVTLIGGKIPEHVPGAYPTLACCGGSLAIELAEVWCNDCDQPAISNSVAGAFCIRHDPRFVKIERLTQEALALILKGDYSQAGLKLNEAANATHWMGADLSKALAGVRATSQGLRKQATALLTQAGLDPVSGERRGLDSPAGAGSSVEADRG